MGNMSGPKRVWGTLDAICHVIKEPQVVVYRTDQPDLFLDLFDADVLTSKYLASVDIFSAARSRQW